MEERRAQAGAELISVGFPEESACCRVGGHEARHRGGPPPAGGGAQQPDHAQAAQRDRLRAAGVGGRERAVHVGAEHRQRRHAVRVPQREPAVRVGADLPVVRKCSRSLCVFCRSPKEAAAQSVGCTIGCETCDGGAKGPSNPNRIDRCGAGMKATNNDPATRTINRNAVAGSAADWTKFNPWRVSTVPALLRFLL